MKLNICFIWRQPCSLRTLNICVLLLTALTTLAEANSRKSVLTLRGINLCGAEFGENYLPGIYGRHYIYPTASSIEYFLARGLQTIRLPFRWERLQPELGQEFTATELKRLQDTVNYIVAAGGRVIIDPHNFARYNDDLVGSDKVSTEHFADLWRRLAELFKNQDRVIFGLVNEPHDILVTSWLEAANAAIAAIRATGAQNLVLVPGANWSGAFSWPNDWGYGSNARVMLGVIDPAKNFAFEVHLYFDRDNSGSTDSVISETIGRERLVGFAEWCRGHNFRAFLGEVGAPESPAGLVALRNTLLFLETEAQDVFLGWTYWAAGQWWPEGYRFVVQPQNPENPDEPEHLQLQAMRPFLPVTHRVQFNLTAEGTRNGGGGLVQYVTNAAAAIAPLVQARLGWRCTGWDLPFNNLTGDLTVTAIYEPTTYTLTYAASENGRVNDQPQVVQVVGYAKDGLAVTAQANPGYRFYRWSDGNTNASRSDTAVLAELTVTAEFVPELSPASNN